MAATAHMTLGAESPFSPMMASSFPGGVSYDMGSIPTESTDTNQEARRMTTPPIKEETADARPRGVFFDINANPNLSPVSGSTSSSRKTLKVPGKKQAITSDRPKEWWDKQQLALQRQTTTGGTYFDFDVPEHLPNSPQCPAHPLHASGGRGVCVVR